MTKTKIAIISSVLLFCNTNISYWYELSDIEDKFTENRQIIWCWKWLETRWTNKWNCYYWTGWHNIYLPPKKDLEVYKEVFGNSVSRILNSFPTENRESWFDENAWNKHAKWYVQTLRKWNIDKWIKPQLEWKRNRQDHQKTVWWCSKIVGEEAIISCLYRLHYHATKWYRYSDESMSVREYYYNYLLWQNIDQKR